MHDSLHAAPNLMTGTRRTRWPRRAPGLVAGLAFIACSIGLICAGAFAAWVRSDGTYWRTTLFGWAGSVQLKVAAEDHQPIFVGVTTPDAMSRYLAGVAFTTISEQPGSGVASTDHRGAAPETPPARAVAWTAHAEGVGTQTLRWKATDGRQTAFAMNANGSRSVQVRIESATVTLDRMPWWVPAGAIALGSFGLASGVFALRQTWRPYRP